MAAYERASKLNVREKPSPSAKVVRTMEHGEAAEVEVIENGWCKVEDGYIRADLVTVRLDGGKEPVSNESKEPDKPQGNERGLSSDAQVSDAESDDASGLRAMTILQLRELAGQSGIKIPSGVNKEGIIAAILSDE